LRFWGPQERKDGSSALDGTGGRTYQFRTILNQGNTCRRRAADEVQQSSYRDLDGGMQGFPQAWFLAPWTIRMTERAYLDWNATAPLRPEARAAMAAALDLPGNPSSIHAEGRAARAAIERARAQVAALFAVETADVTFTSGGDGGQ
jgi:hypothetical protein